MENEVRQRLRKRGLRATPQRVVILGVLHDVEGHRHLSARDVFEEAENRLPGLNQATVYRTLEDLQGAGLVDSMHSGHDAVRYAVHDPEHRHGHLVCRSCGSVLVVGFGLVSEVARLLQEATGFQVDRDHLTLQGLCQKCAR